MYTRSDAPSDWPASETIEALLNIPHYTKPHRKTLDELSDKQKQATGLVEHRRSKTSIRGDAYGLKPAWAGNVAHPLYPAADEILPRCFNQLKAVVVHQNDEIKPFLEFLGSINNMDVHGLMKRFALKDSTVVIRDDVEETTVTFELTTMSVRYIQMKMIAKDIDESYEKTSREMKADHKSCMALGEPIMSIKLLRHFMALIAKENRIPRTSREKTIKVSAWRALAQEKF